MVKNAVFVAGAAAVASAVATPLQHRDTTGCGISHHTGYNDGEDSHQVKSGDRTRFYGINVPNSYNDDLTKRWPLIVDYHGSSDTPKEQYENSMYYNYDDGQDYLVVYPQGVDKHWQGPTYATEGVDDLQFTTDLLAHLRTAYCIDDNHIYASGKSNGAGFVDTLACSDNGDEFAAFAMASAALYTDTSKDDCTKKRAILESHGDEDHTIPYHPTEDGNGGPLPDITQWVSWWGERNCGSDAAADMSGDLGGYNTTMYSCGGYDTPVVQHYQVFDLGHCWPSSSGQNFDATSKGGSCLDNVLDFTPVVLDFFASWDLSSAPSN